MPHRLDLAPVRPETRRSRHPDPRVDPRVRTRAARADRGRAPAQRGRRAGADRAGDRRARTRVRGRRPRAGAGRRAGARRDARPAAHRPRLRHVGAARRHRAAARGVGRRDLGHGPRLRHHRLPEGAVDRRGDDVPLRGLRPVVAQADRRLRRHPRGRPGPARLHHQRDGGAAARPGGRGPVRRRRRPGLRSAPHAGHARGLLLRRPAADDAGRAVRRAARLRRSHPRWSPR